MIRLLKNRVDNMCFEIINNLILDLLGESDKTDVELIEDTFRRLENNNYPLTSEFLKRRQFGYIKKALQKREEK